MRVITYFYKSGLDPKGNPLHTVEARIQGQRVTVCKDGLYKEEAEQMSGKITRNPERFGF